MLMLKVVLRLSQTATREAGDSGTASRVAAAAAGSLGLAQSVGHGSGQQKPGSGMFSEIGPAEVCIVDYPEHTALKSPQEHRPGSAIPSELFINQVFKFA